MSELRYNIATGDWVIFSTSRARRPHDFVQAKKRIPDLPGYKENCPFCPGNEKMAGAELFRLGDSKIWKARSVPNLFPALSRDESPGRKSDGFYTSMGGFGSHEVIVENRRHNTCIALMTYEEVEDILRVYLDRYAALEQVPGIESVIIFKNHGPMAGCSLEHPHSQVVATPIIPPNMRARIILAADYFKSTGYCVYCKMIEEELKAKVRVLMDAGGFVSFLPFAGALPFTAWIVPKRHSLSFAEMEDTELKDLARTLKDTIKRLYYGLADPDYNLTIRSYPARSGDKKSLHWYLGIIPRLSEPGGFEMGAMMAINTSLPEEAAAFLHNVNFTD